MTCRLKLMIGSDEEQNLTWNRSGSRRLVEKISAVILFLIEHRYSHFVVYVNAPMDYRLAEILYYLKIGCKIEYSLGFCLEIFDDLLNTIENGKFEPAGKIVAAAKRIIWRRDDWVERKFYVVKIF